MDIEHLGEAVVQQLVNRGLVRDDFADLYRLRVADVEALEGFGCLVDALGIRLVGEHVALGGRASDTVSRRTDSVVVAEAPGRKLEQARRLGVRTLGPAEFEALLAGTR